MAESLAKNEYMLEIEGGDKFVYFDSGVPKEDRPYTTCIFIHGLFFNHRSYFWFIYYRLAVYQEYMTLLSFLWVACHTKHLSLDQTAISQSGKWYRDWWLTILPGVWSSLLSNIQPKTRLLAYSTCGYAPSPPFSESESSKVRERLGDDLSSIIAAFISQLSLLSNPSSSIKLLAWSLGHNSLLSAYSLLSSDNLGYFQKTALDTQISEVILFELPASLCLAVPPSAATKAQRESGKDLSPQDALLHALIG